MTSAQALADIQQTKLSSMNKNKRKSFKNIEDKDNG